MKTNEEYRLLEQKLFDCENEVAIADLKVRKLEAQLSERDRSVIKANEQAERFEREWYLRGDELDEAQKLLLLAKGALESANECIGLYSHPGSKLVMEALAAIDDSKLVEGLILCDAEPFCTYYDIDGTIGICRPDIEVPHGAEVPLYAPRRTEK